MKVIHMIQTQQNIPSNLQQVASLACSQIIYNCVKHNKSFKQIAVFMYEIKPH